MAITASSTDRPRRHRPSILFGLITAMIGPMMGADEPPAKLPVGASEPGFTLLRVDGRTVSGHLRQLDLNTGVELIDGASSGEVIPIAGVVKLTRDQPPPPPPTEDGVLLFPEGDRLFRAGIKDVGETHIKVQSFTLGTLAIPVESVLGLVLASPADPSALPGLIARTRETPRKSELLWLANGDRLEASLIGLDDKSVTIKNAAGQVKLDRSSLVSIGFDPGLISYPKPNGPYLEVLMLDNSRVGLQGVRLDGGYLSGQTRFGLGLKIPIADVSQIHVRSSSIAYLSDVPALQDRYREFVGPTRPYRRDANVLGGPMRLQGRSYEHGIGTQPRTLLAYRVEPGWKRFQGTVGLDDAAGPLAHVVFRVIVDGEEKASSPPIASRDTPHTFDVDIAGARSIVLITEFGERGNIHDLADWADARLTK